MMNTMEIRFTRSDMLASTLSAWVRPTAIIYKEAANIFNSTAERGVESIVIGEDRVSPGDRFCDYGLADGARLTVTLTSGDRK